MPEGDVGATDVGTLMLFAEGSVASDGPAISPGTDGFRLGICILTACVCTMDVLGLESSGS